jgi:hypothetical protein
MKWIRLIWVVAALVGCVVTPIRPELAPKYLQFLHMESREVVMQVATDSAQACTYLLGQVRKAAGDELASYWRCSTAENSNRLLYQGTATNSAVGFSRTIEATTQGICDSVMSDMVRENADLKITTPCGAKPPALTVWYYQATRLPEQVIFMEFATRSQKQCADLVSATPSSKTTAVGCSTSPKASSLPFSGTVKARALGEVFSYHAETLTWCQASVGVAPIIFGAIDLIRPCQAK